MQQAHAGRAGERTCAEGEQHQCDGGGQRETGPGRQRAEEAGAHQPNGEPDLAAGRPRQELAQPDEIGVGVLIEPLPADHELVAEIANMGDRATEAGQPKLEEDTQDFKDRTVLRRLGRC